MSIASEILRIQQAKQAIKDSINNKGGALTNETLDAYAQAIDNLPSGGGMTYEDYARTLYLAWGKSNQFTAAWEHSLAVDPEEISASNLHTGGGGGGGGGGALLGPRGTAQYPNGEAEGVIIPQGVTTIGLNSFTNWTSNNQPLVIPNSVTSIDDSAFYYWTSNNQPLVIPNSVTSIGGSAFLGWSSNNQPLTISNSVTSIVDSAFYYWSSNNQPLVIPNSVTSIGGSAFLGWSSNNQPLTISNSVTSIGGSAFLGWESNTHPLVIPDSVTSIGRSAFFNWSLVPYVEIQAITPPTLTRADAFDEQNNAPIYVPDESVEAYKTATNWVDLASRIFGISEKS